MQSHTPTRHKSRAITKNLNGMEKRRFVQAETRHFKSIWDTQKESHINAGKSERRPVIPNRHATIKRFRKVS